MNNKNAIQSVTVSISIILGLLIQELLGPNMSKMLSYVITFLASTTIYHILFWLLTLACSNIPLLVKAIWGRLYLQGYWSYTYQIADEKRYGAWVITQTYDSIKVVGFGIDPATGRRRSDVESVSQLIPVNNAYEIVNARKDIDENGNFPGASVFSKTTLHLHERRNLVGIPTYPLVMTGQTEIYGSKLDGNVHQELRFQKYKDVKSEDQIIEKVKAEIAHDKVSA